MKKIPFLLLVFILVNHLVSAQFRVGIGVGGNMPSSSVTPEDQQTLSLKGINDWGMEARVIGRYALTKKVDIGVDLDISAFYGKNELTLENYNYTTGKSVVTSSQLTMDYYLFGGGISPYAGFGIGVTKATTRDLDLQNVRLTKDLIRTIAFTYSPRLGVRLGKVNAEFTYMFIKGKVRDDSIFGGISDNLLADFGHYKFSLIYLWGSRTL